jgi:hypothetical protein
MKRFATIVTSASLVLAAAAAAFADPVTITFENPPCAALSNGFFPGDCYASLGVVITSDINGGRFSARQFAIVPSAQAVSPTNVATPATPEFLDILANFTAPGGGVGFTDFVSWHFTGSIRGQDPWEGIIFGTTGVLARTTFGFTDQLVTFSRPTRDITGFRMAAGNIRQGMDNLSFNAPTAQSPVVPEPSTLMMLATAAGVFLRRRLA